VIYCIVFSFVLFCFVVFVFCFCFLFVLGSCDFLFCFQNVLLVDMESILNHIVIHVSTRYVTDLTEIVHMAALTDLEKTVVT
jgi:hypothetical protein